MLKVYSYIYLQAMNSMCIDEYMYTTQANIESKLSQISRTIAHRSLLSVFSIEFAGVNLEFKRDESLYRGMCMVFLNVFDEL
jgi:hypothetical protein